MTVPAVNAVRIESAVDIAEAALAEPLACVVHSTDLLTRADARYTLAASNGQAVRTAVVCEAGPSGLLFVQYLRRVLAFDGRLLVVEPNAKRRRWQSVSGPRRSILSPLMRPTWSGSERTGEAPSS